MIKINFKRILSRREIKTQIDSILELDSNPIAICDYDGNCLYGDESVLSMKKYSVTDGNNTFGYVCGGKNAKTISDILSYACIFEIDKKSLGLEVLDRYKEITVLYDMSEKLAGTLKQSEILQLIIGEIKRLIKADDVSIMIFEDDVLVKAYSNQKTISRGRFGRNQGIAGAVASSRKAEIVNDVSKDPRFIPRKTPIYSLMCVPLIVKDGIMGVISASCNEKHYYTANDLKIVSALAFQASISLENARLYESLNDAFIEMVHTLAETIEKRDPYTGGHTKRVMEYSITVGEILGLPSDELERLRLGAIVHDIGKIGIRDSILLKTEQLAKEEYEQIKQHTVYGHEILNNIKYLQNIIPAVRHHHERYDGKGYPDQLQGEAIDIIARIISVADAYDAMSSDRPYRKSMGHSIALEEIRKNSGLQFDPLIVKAFETACDTGKIGGS